MWRAIMAGHPFLLHILILLAASVIAVALFRRLRLPAILAYLLVGASVGPFGFGWIEQDDNTAVLAEFGVVFLLFTVGLKFSLAQFLAMRREVVVMGGGQVALTTVSAGALAWLAGLPPAAALVAGGALAMSSTAIVTRLLSEQVELNTPHGRSAMGILLFQDIAVLPFLIALPVLAGDAETPGGDTLLQALGKGTLLVLLMLAAGRWMLRPVLHEVARARSSELFTLTALLFALTAAGASHAADLSMPLGAFLAGMLLGETEFRHQVEADIRPFQDVLLGLFFITIGMLLDPRVLAQRWPEVLLLTTGLLLGKVVIVTGLGRFMGRSSTSALRVALVVAQGGEFGLVMLALALEEMLLEPATGQLLLTAVVLSMAVAPFPVRHNRRLAAWFYPEAFRRSREEVLAEVQGGVAGLHGHVLICGYGRIGQSLTRFLDEENIPYFALDLDPVRVRDARAAGERVGFGDATQADILAAAGLSRARAVVVSFDDAEGAEKVLSMVRGQGLALPVLVRTRDNAALERLHRAGATEAVPETLEAGLILASHLLTLLAVPAVEVAQRVQAVRRDRYRLLRGFFLGQEPIPFDQPEAGRERLHTVTLPNQAHAVGRRLGQIGLREAGVITTAVRRDGIRGSHPQPEMRLRAGDTLVLYGSPEELARAEALLLRGG